MGAFKLTAILEVGRDAGRPEGGFPIVVLIPAPLVLPNLPRPLSWLRSALPSCLAEVASIPRQAPGFRTEFSATVAGARFVL